MNCQALEYVKVSIAFFFLTYFSILDLRTRSVPSRLMWLFLAVSLILMAASIPNYATYSASEAVFYAVINASLGPMLLYALFKARLIGDADVVIISSLTLLHPLPNIYDCVLINISAPLKFPPILPIILYANLMVILYLPVNIVVNLVKYREFYKSIKASLWKKAMLLAESRPVEAGKYLSMKHRYLLEDYKLTDGMLVREVKLSFNILEDYTTHRDVVEKLLNEGFLKPRDLVLTTYGIPFIVLLLFSYTVFLIIGDALMLILLLRLFH
ncbi:MAG: prepilin peptidase [Sulfolobales archaeon]|nr:prepilin peptidase [Sulfolobales archaeon]MCX8199053.1 prepilin peptidase [Sulfolobales archaeon]MDW8170032.1 A24 family peptidase C-terminal domain-containing protein [Desulfurococcaceae archaeon]